MVAVPGVRLAALNASVQVPALISEAAPQRAVVEGAPAPSIVLERSDSLPFLVWDLCILVRWLVLKPAFGAFFVLLHHLLLALPAQLVLASAATRRPVRWRCGSFRRAPTLGRCLRSTGLSLLELFHLRGRACVVPELLVILEDLEQRVRERGEELALVTVELDHFLSDQVVDGEQK